MTSTPRHSEAAFETVIEQHVLANGYVAVSRDGFDRERAIFPSVILDFIKDTQPKEWAKLEAVSCELPRRHEEPQRALRRVALEDRHALAGPCIEHVAQGTHAQ